MRLIFIVLILVFYSCIDSATFLDLSEYEICSKKIWGCLKANPKSDIYPIIESFHREHPSMGRIEIIVYCQVIDGLIREDSIYVKKIKSDSNIYLRNEKNNFKSWGESDLFIHQISDLKRNLITGEVVREIVVSIENDRNSILKILWIEESPFFIRK
jgi:hypothetical protein